MSEILNLENTANAYQYKSNSELRLSKRMFQILRNPFLNKIGGWLIVNCLRIKLPIKYLIKKTIYKQFVGGTDLDSVDVTAAKIYNFGVTSMLDYGTEGKNDEHGFDEITEQFLKSIEYASTKDYFPFICIKISGLCHVKLLERLDQSPRLRSGINDFETQSALWNQVRHRAYAIVDLAAKKNISVLIDAEESWIQDPIDRLCIELMQHFNKDKAVVYGTYQMYLNDRLDFFKMNHQAIALKNGFILGAKIVRGAYMEKERHRANQNKYPSPININKEKTDSDFNAAVDYALKNINNISVIVATHNEESCLFASQKMAALRIKNNDPRVYFSQLFGMKDHISFNLAKAGYNVSKYLPYGTIAEVIPYLMRRANENSSISEQSAQEITLITNELKKRLS